MEVQSEATKHLFKAKEELSEATKYIKCPVCRRHVYLAIDYVETLIKFSEISDSLTAEELTEVSKLLIKLDELRLLHALSFTIKLYHKVRGIGERLKSFFKH
jgi:hypothetical protein